MLLQGEKAALQMMLKSAEDHLEVNTKCTNAMRMQLDAMTKTASAARSAVKASNDVRPASRSSRRSRVSAGGRDTPKSQGSRRSVADAKDDLIALLKSAPKEGSGKLEFAAQQWLQRLVKERKEETAAHKQVWSPRLSRVWDSVHVECDL